MTIYPTPLQSEGLSRRIYPFLGIAIVGVATIHGLVPVTRSVVLALGFAVGIGLVLLPLLDLGLAVHSRLLLAAPVIAGFVLALYPLDCGERRSAFPSVQTPWADRLAHGCDGREPSLRRTN